MDNLEHKIWWEYIGEDLQNLFITSKYLIKISESWTDTTQEIKDYAFVVFPAAKAYEGFLKKMFLDLGFITEEDYFGKRFRIGKSLNPSLPRLFRRTEVYGKIVKYCGGKKLADQLWNTWRITRNLTFHWFPNEKNAIDLSEAKVRVDMIIQAIDDSFKDCSLTVDSQNDYILSRNI